MKTSLLWLSPCVFGQSFRLKWLPVLVVSLLVFTTSMSAHICGPTTITVEVGKTVTWRIKADVAESEETAYGLTTFPDANLVEVDRMGPFFEYNYGQWTIYGKQVGTTTMTAGWSYAPNNAASSCSVTINVVPTSSRPKPAGEEHNGGTANDPVNTANGELFFHTTPDLFLDGPIPLEFKRYYSSLMLDSGIPQSNFGINWRHNFDLVLNRVGTNITVTFLEGRPIRFQQSVGSWNLIAPTDIRYQLREVGGNFVMLDPESRRRYAFDAEGRLLSIKDRNNNTLTVTYSDGGNGINIASIADGLGRQLSFTYFSFQYLRTVSDGTRTVAFDYSNDRIAFVQDARGFSTSYTYDSFSGDRRGLLLQTTRPRANTPILQTYDAERRVKDQSDAFANKSTFTYDGLQTTVTAPDGGTVVHTHDAEGRLIQSVRSDAGTIQVGYSPANLRNSITNATNAPRSYAFDLASGFIEYITNALGQVTRFSYTNQTDADGFTYRDVSEILHPDGSYDAFFYDGNGNRLVRRDRSGNTWTCTYNARGQMLTELNPLGGTTTCTYNADGTLATKTDPASNLASYTYDALKRRIKITHAEGTFRQWNFDNQDRILNWTNEVGHVVTYVYDNNGNLTRVTDAKGDHTNYAYDNGDRLIRVTDRLGTQFTYEYDKMGRVKSLTSGFLNSVGYGYDLAGNLRYITNSLGEVRTNHFDENGRMTAVVDTLGNTNQHIYDAEGRITSMVTPEGNLREFGYDNAHRVVSFGGSGGRPTHMQFDGRGWVTNMAVLEPGARTSIQRNGLGQVTKIITPRNDQWTFAYDTSGRATSQIDPSGKTTTSTYDTRNRVSSITYPDGMGSVQLSYNGVNELTRRLFSDGLDLQYTYDTIGRLTGVNGVTVSYDDEGRIASCNGFVNTIDEFSGRITEVEVAPFTYITYTYDAMGRVTQVNDWAGGVTTLAYDAAGRLTSITRPNGLVTTYTHNKDGRLTGIFVNNNLNEITLSYDGEGNLTSDSRHQPLEFNLAANQTSQTFTTAEKRTGTTYDALGRVTSSGGTTYTWNLAGFMTGYTSPSRTVQFEYNGFGHVTRRTENSVSRDFVWNYSFYFPRITKETRDGSDHRYYVHLPSGQLLYSLEAADNARTDYHFDEQGNTLFLSDAAGNPTAVYAYLPYGEKQVDGAPGENLFTFQGAWSVLTEPEENLYVMGVRPYDAGTGRFLSRDEAFPNLNPQALNPYAYAVGNPLRYFDPLGMAPNAAGGDATSTGARVAEGTRATLDSAGAIQGIVGHSAETALAKAQTIAKATVETFGDSTFNINGATQALKAEEQALKLNNMVNGKGMKALGHAGTGAQLIGIGRNMWKLHEQLGKNASESERQAALALRSAELMARNAFDSYEMKAINYYQLRQRLNDANYWLRRRLLDIDDTYYADLALQSFRTGLESLGSFIPDFGLFTGSYIDGATSLGQAIGTDSWFEGIFY